MKSKGKILIFIILSIQVIIYNLHGQNLPINHKIYQNYINNELSQWELIIRQLENIYQKNPKVNVLYLLTQTEYGFLGYLMTMNDTKNTEKYIKSFEKHIDMLSEYKAEWADVYAFKAAYLGFLIRMNGYKAPVLGPKSYNFINMAIKTDKNAPLGWLVKARADYHLPDVFGGSIEKSIKSYLEAIEVIEKEGKTNLNWLYLNALLDLAKAYTEIGAFEQAKSIYEKALIAEPDFHIVKNKQNKK